MSDHAEVELDTARRPRSAQGDVAKFEHLVAVDELLAARLLDRPPDLAAHLGQDVDDDVLVLEPHHLPRPPLARVGVVVEGVVGVEAGIPDQDRIRIRVREGIGLDAPDLLFDHGLWRLCFNKAGGEEGAGGEDASGRTGSEDAHGSSLRAEGSSGMPARGRFPAGSTVAYPRAAAEFHQVPGEPVTAIIRVRSAFSLGRSRSADHDELLE